MKTRIIQTRFWDDEIQDSISLYAQHLYIFILTSQYINISGYFQLSESKIKFEAKLTDNQFSQAKEELAEEKKVLFHKGWVWVVNARKNNRYENSNLNVTACERELERVPKEIKEFFDTTIKVLSIVPINNNKEIINNKSEIIINKFNNINNTKYKSLEFADNLEKWLTVYSMEEIEAAIEKIPKDPYWKDKMTPTILFRQKNPQGEKVDYIGHLLNLKIALPPPDAWAVADDGNIFMTKEELDLAINNKTYKVEEGKVWKV